MLRNAYVMHSMVETMLLSYVILCRGGKINFCLKKGATIWELCQIFDPPRFHRNLSKFSFEISALKTYLFKLYWHKLKTLNPITKLIMFSHNCFVTRNYIKNLLRKKGAGKENTSHLAGKGIIIIYPFIYLFFILIFIYPDPPSLNFHLKNFDIKNFR